MPESKLGLFPKWVRTSLAIVGQLDDTFSDSTPGCLIILRIIPSYQVIITEHSESISLDILSLLLQGLDILSLRYAPAEELTVYKDVSTSLS